ncbi:MAG TPA: hypothetical protein VLM37_07155 [Fibrobacteraceae bacterium]|nr:hypothetical protein [Fibrobacteraceae bacterium]
MKPALLPILLLSALESWSTPFDEDSVTAAGEIRSAPLQPGKVEWQQRRVSIMRFQSAQAFSSDDLWAVLDWSGGESGWMEIDPTGALNPGLKPLIQGASQSWFRRAPGVRPLIAILRSKSSVSLEIRALPQLGPDPRIPLQCRYDGGQGFFADFSLTNSGLCALNPKETCHYVHQEDPRLHADVSQQRIRMTLHIPDAEPFPLTEHFSLLTQQSQREVLQTYRDYFRHEFSLAVRSFIETTPGLFNWQTWNWMEWADESLISSQEIQAILESGAAPGRIELFHKKCQDGRKVRFWSDGQGTLGMELE